MMQILIPTLAAATFFGLSIACSIARSSEPAKSFERSFYGWLAGIFAVECIANLWLLRP
jgi:hypothetical protein